MNSLNLNRSTSKIYHFTSTTAYAYSIILLFFYIYKETLYVDKTWFHGLFSIIFSVFSSIILIGILIVFSIFIDKIVKYKKANTLIYVYIFFLFLSTFSIVSLLISTLKVYYSQQTIEDSNSVVSYTGSLISNVFIVILSRIGLFFTGILFGNRIRKIHLSENSIFIFLGFLFIVYNLIIALEYVKLLSNEILSGIINIVIIVLIAYILRLKFDTNENINEPLNVELSNQTNENFIDTVNNEKSILHTNNYENIANLNKNNFIASSQIESNTIDLDQLPNKNESIDYYENISDFEKNRLKFLIAKSSDKTYSEDEINKRIILHISENKLFDNNRFTP